MDYAYRLVVTENIKTARTFINGVNSAIAMLNASTQFADGGEFGFARLEYP